MNTNDKNTNNRNDRNQNTNTNDNRRDDEQFWAEWWREYAETWK